MNDLGEYYSADWAYFDKELLRKVAEDHHLPERVQKFLNEEKRPILNQMLNELLGIHPPIMELVHKMARTILNLAEFGNVIIIGRGSNLITNHLSNTVHFRFIAPLNKRNEDLQKSKNISRDWAQKIIIKEDENRKGFLNRVFKKDIDDPTIYHAVINMSKYSENELVKIIESIVKNKVPVKKNLRVPAEITESTKIN
jgi:cytidylate kinase